MFSVGVVGASGYAGGELLRILAGHPEFELAAAVSETYSGQPLTSAFPGLGGKYGAHRFVAFEEGAAVQDCELVLLAQENGRAMKMAPALLSDGRTVVDLSADFRFRDEEIYARWYGGKHACPELARAAVYGLPELHKDQIRSAKLVGNPGCYPTASTLAMAPLLADGLVRPDSIIIDAKSGVSGAGRAKFALDYHYPEMNESVSAYKLGGTHRHTPEIEATLSSVAGSDIRLTFSPQLMPMTRGILATCYASMNEPMEAEYLRDRYRAHYSGSPFVRILDTGTPATKHTSGTNWCHIGIVTDPATQRVIVVSAIDNLVKGAAGQAVQNLNLMCGIDETAGLANLMGNWP